MSINTKMTALADEVRTLSGTTTSKGIDAMTNDIDAANTEISSQALLISQIALALEEKASGTDTSDATATANDILADKTAYVGGVKVTGTIAVVEQAIPTITLDTTTGLITATATQDVGYVSSGTKSATKQLTFAEGVNF